MKKMFFLAGLFLTILMFCSMAYADEQKLRVGLESSFKGVSSVNISDTAIYVGVNESLNSMINGNNFTVRAVQGYYLKSNQSFQDYFQAQNAANGLQLSNIQAIPTLVGVNSWCIYFGSFSSLSEAQKYASSIALATTACMLQPNAVGIYENNLPKMLSDSSFMLQLKAADGITELNTTGYRGIIEFMCYNSVITVVNVIEIEEYLYGVIPSEMPSSWNIEALKAQAVAGRTYTVSKKGKHLDKGYDLCDTTDCQVYHGTKNEAVQTTEAINATKGKLIYYNNNIIEALYFSSSGGYTESAENVWGNAVPYLTAVPDVNEVGAKEWTRSFKFSEIESLLLNNNINIGTVTNIGIDADSETGRVKSLTIIGTNGTKVLEKEAIRTFFAKSSGGSLESRNFSLKPQASVSTSFVTVSTQSFDTTSELRLSELYILNDGQSERANESISVIGSTGNIEYKATTKIETASSQTNSSSLPGTITFYGKGWGHGVGMSQCGAKGMAEKGYTYEQILKHYYTGTEIY